MSGRAASF